jgi:hypothetical protein
MLSTIQRVVTGNPSEQNKNNITACREVHTAHNKERQQNENNEEHP